MQKTILFLILITLNATVYAQVPIPAAPKLRAEAWILLDHHSGQILTEHNADKRIEPASITKVMTSYVAYQALQADLIKLNDEVKISEKAWRMRGSRMFVEVGTKVAVKDLLKGLVIQSGNDAAVALAEHIAGSEEAFVEQMNTVAQNLGLTGTHYMNATGWPGPDHYTTARDIAMLSQALINDFPEYYAVYAEKEFTYNNIPQRNRNRLLWRSNDVDGIKTGHTEAAGYCLAASAKRGEMRLLTVVMGTDSDNARFKDSQTLLNYGFRYYQTHKLYSVGEVLKEVRIWKGNHDWLALGLSEDLYVTIPKGQYDSLSIRLENIPALIEAPIEKAAPLGEVQVKMDEAVIVHVPAIALNPVNKGTFFSRAIDSVLLLFE